MYKGIPLGPKYILCTYTALNPEPYKGHKLYSYMENWALSIYYAPTWTFWDFTEGMVDTMNHCYHEQYGAARQAKQSPGFRILRGFAGFRGLGFRVKGLGTPNPKPYSRVEGPQESEPGSMCVLFGCIWSGMEVLSLHFIDASAKKL